MEQQTTDKLVGHISTTITPKPLKSVKNQENRNHEIGRRWCKYRLYMISRLVAMPLHHVQYLSSIFRLNLLFAKASPKKRTIYTNMVEDGLNFVDE